MSWPARLDVVCQLVTHAPQGSDHHAVMGQLDVAHRCQRGFAAVQRVLDARGQQPVFNGIEPLWTFGVTCAHLVFPAIFMCEISGSVHGVNIFG